MKNLIVITGATGSGKTGLALQVAGRLGCDIISADSRQIYRDIPIGTAAPTPEQLAAVHHHFVGILPLDAYYSAAAFEEDVMALLPRLWQKGDYAVMCGGSMMYVDAVCNGIDPLPTVDPAVREQAWEIYETGGIEALRTRVKEIDPVYYEKADLDNYKRLVHAVEITIQAGVPYSSLCTGRVKSRPFNIVKVAIDWPRDQLFERINSRVDTMIAEGFEEEARRVYPLRHLNSLNTVGYKELFSLFDGVMDRETAIPRIAKNTRVYAKKQLTWLKRDRAVKWLDPSRDMLLQVLDILKLTKK